MKHPITQKLKYIFIYIGIWALILCIHTATLAIYNDLSILKALVDGLVFCSIFSALGMALWYPVLYNDIEKHSITNLIFNHLSIMILSLAFWISLSVFLVKVILSGSPEYIATIDDEIPWRIFTGIFYYVALVMVYYLLIYGYNLREHTVQESRLKEKVKEAELQTLKSQINPHFLFNGLNSISSLTITNPEKAHEMIIQLSSFLRYSLAHDANQLIPLKQEIENIEAYIAVEKIRFGEKLAFSKNMSEECCDTKVPFLILQPLIENAIKHGVYESTKPVSVMLSCEAIENGNLHIKIRNDFDPEAIPRKGTGTGIRNIKERLKIIYQLDELITFNKADNYFEVNLVIPSKAAFKQTQTL